MFHKKISYMALVLLIIAAMDSIRNFPASALFGSTLIFFFIFAAIVFLIPTALVSAELSATFPEKGGVYHWIHTAFGEKLAMLGIWMQWVNTIVWYPTILSFIAGTAAYLVDPDLAQHKGYLVSVILIVFWGLTLVNLKGIHISAKVNSLCAIIGTIIPMIFLIVLGAIWFFSGKPLQITLNASTVFPSLTETTNWVALVAIMASFLGMELSGVHVNDIRNPQKYFPRAILTACLFILTTMVLGSLTIAFVLPEQDINLVAGVMQVFTNFFDAFGMRQLIPVLTVLIVIGSIGGMTNWLIAPAKGLLHAAEFGYMPKFFTRKNKSGAASPVLLAQAILVSLFCLVFFLVPSVSAFYWFLTALSTELYMIMYVLMFISALRLHYKYVNREKVFKIPGGNIGMWVACMLGLFGCFLTISVSFLPPPHVNIGSYARYVTMIIIGNVILISPVALFYFYKKQKQAKSG